MGVESGVHFPEPLEATDQQAGANQQHQGKRDFHHHQNAARAIAGGIGIGSPESLLQSFIHIRPAELQCGQDSGEHAGDNRDEQSETKYLEIETYVDRMRQFIGQEGHDQPDTEMSVSESEQPAAQCHQNTLHQNLADDPS